MATVIRHSLYSSVAESYPRKCESTSISMAILITSLANKQECIRQIAADPSYPCSIIHTYVVGNEAAPRILYSILNRILWAL